MKNLSRPLFAPTLAAAVLLACTPTNAARRVRQHGQEIGQRR